MTATTQLVEAAPPARLSISEVSAVTGLTQDTLRWYEREGMFPRIARGTDRRRAYDHDDVARIMLLVKLRRTGMSVTNMQKFVQLLQGGAETHPERMRLLREHRVTVLAQLAQVQGDLDAVDAKISYYEGLLDPGLDCAGSPRDDSVSQFSSLTNDSKGATV
jgi:DNA-binding transcriptional MerR regulator